MPAIYHEGSWLGNATDPEVLVKDTVGWTGKNKLDITLEELQSVNTSGTWNGNVYTYRNTTFTFNSNKTVSIKTLSGGASGLINFDLTGSISSSGDVIFSQNASGSNTTFKSFITAQDGSGDIANTGTDSSVAFNTNKEYKIHTIVYSGATVDTTLYPMLRDADITDPTYEPYHESVEVMYEEEIHGVNLLKNTATSQTANGVTFTKNADGSVTANGTATASAELVVCYDLPSLYGGRYILSGCPSGGAINKYRITAYRVDSIDGQSGSLFDIGNGLEFTYKNTTGNAKFIIYIENGVTVNNLTFRPMLRKADIDDSTYRPYNEQAIQNQLNAQGVLGAKNLLKNTATSQTINGVTFTVSSDGSIMANGTATANMSLRLASNYNIKADTYILTGGKTANKRVYIEDAPTTGATWIYRDLGGGIKFSLASATTCNVGLSISNGETVSNEVFYPMLRLASDPDDTYQPYAMTNRELTEKKINIADLKTVVSASSDFADFKTRIASL